ncbi:cyclic nucleotide-binding domain-containing protein [Pontibacter anaerobius]|uniref:Cyclic nucleotide-binding domain-containing protein n=1 Tax=Pontibacter anaerobius TaxID=2993940 RepID=A0ABT3RDJ8_9BACT|nr:cyclic nucleotide-binding domain-containing protein [Pontibacter anaerobius]MCX2739345.1 cyclic nucleotide-binding domain-containing protein [Pontibacter anaerobius]
MLRKAIEEGQLQVTTRKLAAGTYLYRAGQPTDSFYMLLQGSVLLSIPGLRNDTLVHQGHILGLQDLMQEQFSHTAILDEEAILLEISKQELLKSIQTIAPLRLYLIREMSQQPNLAYLAYE